MLKLVDLDLNVASLLFEKPNSVSIDKKLMTANCYICLLGQKSIATSKFKKQTEEVVQALYSRLDECKEVSKSL